MVFITIVTGAYKPTYNWGPHIVSDSAVCSAKLAGKWMERPAKKQRRMSHFYTCEISSREICRSPALQPLTHP